MSYNHCFDRLTAHLYRAMDTSPHQEEDSTATLAVSGVITALATICVALRFFVRLRISKVRLAWDDWFILIALLVTLLEGGLTLAGPFSCLL